MGAFSKIKKKFKKATGMSPERAFLATTTLGGSELARSGMEAIGFDISDPFGTQAEIDALRAAGELEKANELENRMLVERILKMGEPARERADIAGAQLLDLASAPIGESEDFQRDLREALVQTRFNLTGFGLGESTTAEGAIGETAARTVSAERRRKADLLAFLAGGAETGIPGALSAQGLASQAALSRAQTVAGVGQAKAAGSRQALDLLTSGATLLAFA